MSTHIDDTLSTVNGGKGWRHLEVRTPSDRFNSTGRTMTREDYLRRHALAYPDAGEAES